MVLELETLGGINSAETRVRCLAHIFNLVVKVILLVFYLSCRLLIGD